MSLKEIIVSPLFNKLRKVLKQEDTVLYIGSGISLWSGLPTWKGLILELADFLEEEGLPSSEVIREKADDDLLSAASIGLSSMNNILFKKFIKKACRVGVAKTHNIHKEITSLGPRCFITTNYDQLLEDALKEFKTETHFDVVTNRHLPELASLNQSRYSDFVFKVHGDINDIQSVILSREHYQELYGGDNAALKTLEILLMTRPVIFWGFGLRDPDFLFIKDKIKNIYKESPSEHYAILPDVKPEEIEYWRENYGIRIISYETLKKEDGSNDHSNLLNLIKLLRDKQEASEEIENDYTENSVKGFLTDTEAISVLRFIESQRLQLNINDTDLLPMGISSDNRKFKPYIRVEELIKYKHNAILLGDPGSGKTFHLKYSAVKELETLRDVILNDANNIKELTLPIYIDLKGYTGNIFEMIESMLPLGINLEFIKKKFNITFLLDSFNEMPKTLFEKKLYEKDILKIEKEFKDNIIIISSRTDEGLDKFNYSDYRLEMIDYNFVKRNLEGGYVYSNDVIRLLQKPLYFNLWKKDKIEINANSTPYTILNSFLNNLNKEFEADFGFKLNLANNLSELGYYAIDKGHEKIHIDVVKIFTEQKIKDMKNEFTYTNQFINWLIKKGIFITSAGSNMSFFHQSITEFLAARELSRLYKNNPSMIEHILNNTRWDQALFLTIGFLEEIEGNSFINQIFERDIILSIKAVKYLDSDRGRIIQEILEYILNNSSNYNFEYYTQLSHHLTDLPVSDEHIPLLEKLFFLGNLLGASAANLLDDLYRYKYKSMFYDALFAHRDDFNFGQTLGILLKDELKIDEVKKLVNYLNDFDDEDEVMGLLEGLEKVLSNFNFEDLNTIFGSIENLNNIQLSIFCTVLKDIESEDSLKVLVSLIEKGNKEAIFPIHMFLRFTEIEFNKEIIYRDRFIENIITFLNLEEEGEWALEVLNDLSHFPEIRDYFKQKHKFLIGVNKLALLYCIRREEEELFWNQYRNIIMNKIQTDNLNILRRFKELNWKGKEKLLEEFIQVCEFEDIHRILESFRNYFNENSKTYKLELSFTTIELLLEKLPLKTKDNDYYLMITGEFIINNTDIDVQEKILRLFNLENCEYRDFLSEFVISQISSVTTDRLSEDAIDFLLGKLRSRKMNNFNDILGNISTEKFVENKLLPLLEINKEPLKSNLREILYNAGKNHKKRYLKY